MRCAFALLLLMIMGCTPPTPPQPTAEQPQTVEPQSSEPISFGITTLGANGIASYADGKQFLVELPEDFEETSPVWEQGQPNPPLAAATAIELAVAKRRELVKDTANLEWVLMGATLVPERAGRWYWEVNFELHVKVGGSSGTPPDLRLIVTMDGEVIEPVIN